MELVRTILIICVGISFLSCNTAREKGNRTTNANSKHEINKLYEKATKHNDYFSMVHLGWHYDTGTGIKQNPREAAGWYRMAAEKGGHSMAQNNLGCLYRDGRGVIQDYKRAGALFRLSSEQGNRHAKTNLGWLYERGYGLEINYTESLR
ncbi:MAG TPA: hypothetical protein DEB48_02115, partial [Verrucomicrobiales bacterium]|nr:hypothetical protein [Verrucomicrobiales bacterium]